MHNHLTTKERDETIHNTRRCKQGCSPRGAYRELKEGGKVHLQERCTEDGKMSEDFMSIASNPKYKVYCLTSIGPVEAEEPEYRNGVSYMVKFVGEEK